MFLKAALAVIIALAMALAWQTFQVQGLEKELVVAAVKLDASETSARTLKTQNSLIETQLENFAAKVVKLEQERTEAKAQVTEMVNLFQDHDFANLIKRKPGLIENLMIKKTQEVFNEIEALTAP